MYAVLLKKLRDPKAVNGYTENVYLTKGATDPDGLKSSQLSFTGISLRLRIATEPLVHKGMSGTQPRANFFKSVFSLSESILRQLLNIALNRGLYAEDS